MDPIVVTAGLMHPNVPGCDYAEPKVCDICMDAAKVMVEQVLPGVLENMGVEL